MGKEINFIELGLSADTYYADLIPGNRKLQFLTNSDSHSPWPYRIGREFTRIEMQQPCFSKLKKAIEQKEDGRLKLNVGLDPREGKYHISACNSCYAKFGLKEAEKMQWRCPECKGSIKRGVKDRVMMLADFEKELHPEFRPKYLHTIPLAEIIQLSLGVKGINTSKVQGLWRDFVDRFENEINVLVDASREELAKVDKEVAHKVIAFRNGWVHYIAGGGGNYGKPIICDSREEFEQKKQEIEQGEKGVRGQKTLGEF